MSDDKRAQRAGTDLLESRIRAQEAEMDRKIANGTFGYDALKAEDLERKLLA